MFDLEKVRTNCQNHEDALQDAQSCMCGHCHACGFDPAEMTAALDEIDRLRSLNESLMENGNDLRTRCQKAEARIKELEADRIAYRNLGSRIEDLETYIERLEAAFLDHLAARLYYEHYPGVSDAYSWHDYPEDACHSMPKEEFRKKARDALEEIKTGGKDE